MGALLGGAGYDLGVHHTVRLDLPQGGHVGRGQVGLLGRPVPPALHQQQGVVLLRGQVVGVLEAAVLLAYGIQNALGLYLL